MTVGDYRDVVIEEFAASEQALRQQVSALRAECDSWRLVSIAQMRYIGELTRDLQMLDERQYVHRTRTQDRLDLFLDQTDLRRAEAA